ncbi:MAG: hypothetical protein IPM12_15420 [Flavobacteriales bacterium]|nr:hypothetical protein [Flavobacteriales bacterium]
MRPLLTILLLLPCVALAQDTGRFARALRSERALDRWMKGELHRHRKGHPVTTPSTTYIAHHQTFDSLAAFLRRQPGVVDAEWDRCIAKLDLWPGHSTIGLRVIIDGSEHERCYGAQEGIPGAINLFGGRMQARRNREHLKLEMIRDCPGFVEEQRKHCAGR